MVCLKFLHEKELASKKLGPNGVAIMEVLKSGLSALGGLGDLDPSFANSVLDVATDIGSLGGLSSGAALSSAVSC
jgi:hypothetical protein